MSEENRPAPLRLGSKAPNFDADTTNGPINFHEFIGDNWVVFFSHPEDYTPVCTTELGAFAKLEPEFTKRGVKLIGLSANTIESHGGWIQDINEISNTSLKFPIIGDKERKIAYLYDMLDYQDTTNVDSKGIAFTIRSVFVIDPKKTIRLILSYPASTGRNTAEVLRVVDSLQTGDKHRVTTPINWVPGDDVIVHPSVKNEEAKEIFPEFKIIKPSGSNAYLSSMNASQTSLHRLNTQESSNGDQDPGSARTPASGTQSAGPSPAVFQTAGLNASSTSTGLSGLVCNVHRTTGREPHPLVGASTTIVGDKLYVFGGRRLSRTRPQLTNDMYELDLIRRHWTKLETTGSIPPPRYFHSVCALGDRTLVCYGGMSPAQGSGVPYNPQDPQPEVVVMSDIHLFDVPTAAWMKINVDEAPQGRYAHCAAILPSSAAFTSPNAPLSAINHNPASQNPNQGTIGVSVDGAGGAEMIVVGGQDSANHYIEQISVFNLRSLKWTETSPLGRSCGAYRSVVAPLVSMDASKIGAGHRRTEGEEDQSDVPPAASMLIYSNYNFLDVKLELQVRHPDGSLTEKPMHGNFSPPGLRFPNGGIIANHFVVSGTFLTSSKQEYALWALDLRTLTWSRIDAGGTIFTQGSWNRGVLWNRRNTFVILGNRKRSLVDDYNHRRINFSNVCMVELEAYGLYDNPRKLSPTSAYLSTSSPAQVDLLDLTAGGRTLSPAAHELGAMALGIRELADMDFMCMGGERIPVNSRLIARRWGPYFNQLLQNDIATQDGTDTATLHPGTIGHPSRNSSITITPSIKTTITAYSNATTLTNNNNNNNSSSSSNTADTPSPYEPPSPARANPSTRPRTLYLPHTHLTVQALIHYLYTSALPATHSPLCTPQILCSLLQIARPYRIDGLLEALVERLHTVLDGRNTAAIFNAAAMAAGAGDGISFNPQSLGVPGTPALGLRINTNVGANGHPNGAALEEEASSATSATSRDEEWSAASVSVLGEREVWMGELSAVVGLQKRGLRGLMEGRRIRERGQRPEGGGGGGEGQGLGIA
ncbi:hypothetical protein M501DRAFT_1023694 [Patellaria atrata CBS 101060]|uniref:Thioredoxin domain-containing protein n=1 Tax=Patellaria atrata CBS 101060 TaxID=1346257 RepID=A0A9P4VR19_9PEZI|nr:hypothetical protein M501DRAFT_1023694 [Patellaria atrata CBS 101060]